MSKQIPLNSERFDLYGTLPVLRRGKNIRLIDVEPASDLAADGGPLICDLRVASLDLQEQCSFTALSYVCGEMSDLTRFITCNGYRVRLTPNCYTALCHLRQKLGRFTIWVDSVCINQADEHEKMEQIALMGSVFSLATAVYVWLGEGSSATDRAMAYLEISGLTQYFEANLSSIPEEVSKPRIVAALWHLFTAKLSRTRHPLPVMTRNCGWLLKRRGTAASHDDLRALLDREWIQRMWTYQEVLLASNPIVVCGKYHLPWPNFETGIIFLESSGINYLNNRPIVTTLEAWAEIVLCRDRLVHSGTDALLKQKEGDDDSVASEAADSTRLLRYQKFVLELSWQYKRLTWKNETVGGLCIFAIVIGLGLFFGLFYGETLTPKPPVERLSSSEMEELVNTTQEWSSLTASLAASCRAGNLTTCYKAYDTAQNAGSQVDSVIDKLGHYWIPYRDVAKHVLLPVLALLAVIAAIAITWNVMGRRNRPRMFPVISPGGSKMDLITGICSRKCEKPKDKAFGFHAILQRLSKCGLPDPDSDRTLEDLYKELTIRLIKLTGSLRILSSAALNNFDNAPSWVPNYAADFTPFWLHPSLSRGLPPNATPGSQSSWGWHSDDSNVMCIRGREVCTVGNQYEFQPTLPHYDPSEESRHVANMKTMKRFWKTYMRECLSAYHRDANPVLNRMPAFCGCNTIQRRKLVAWYTYLLTAGEKSPKDLLATLLQKDAKPFLKRKFHHLYMESFLAGHNKSANFFVQFVPTTYREILETQIALCNNLAREDNALFTTNDVGTMSGWADSRLTEYIRGRQGRRDEENQNPYFMKTLGIASCRVRPGDQIVLIAGVSYPLIIRRDTTSTRLISPAIVPFLMAGDKWNPRWGVEDLQEFYLS